VKGMFAGSGTYHSQNRWCEHVPVTPQTLHPAKENTPWSFASVQDLQLYDRCCCIH